MEFQFSICQKCGHSMVGTLELCTKCAKKLAPKQLVIPKAQTTKRAGKGRGKRTSDESKMMRFKEENNVICEFCFGSKDEGYIITIDHIIPISKGGLRTKENLQFLCNKCNFKKADTIY